MRLYLSSFGLGDRPDELLALLGEGRRAAVVLNAKDGSSPASRATILAQEIESLSGLGLEADELDLRAFFGRPEALRSRLAEIDLLWVRGGNTFVLRRAFRQSGLDSILPPLLAEGTLVYGGFSAGAAVLTPSLRDLALVDEPEVVPEGYEPTPIWEGLGLVPYAIAPHYRSDHPESPAIEGLVGRFIDRHVLFRALRDGEAIVISGSSDRVVGRERVD